MKTKLFLLYSIQLFVSFKMIYWTPMSGSYFLYGSIFFFNVEFFGKTAVFPGGYGRMWEILHGRIWPDWGL